MTEPTDDRPRFHGRRHGKPLRPHRADLVAGLLPRLRLDLAAAADPAAAFAPRAEDVWLEIGFGAGEHLAAQAAAHPRVGFIGCEPFVNGVGALLSRIEAAGLDNIRILDDDARHLLPALGEATIGRAFALFADPWPKRRHHKRRLVQPRFLDDLARVLRDGAEFRVASDHMDLVRWTLDQATRHPAFRWTATGPADWRQRPADGFETRYEAKARARGAACVYLTFRRRPRAAAPGAGGEKGL
ncbi:MAG: tRNA (guanosine(46)-N7)-methyltransferase TrmB [Hyphomicrobiales bacterium]|nr:tRNA (guanosine(46)-N7)-methyltransferase TrmB [Hyphomicrobiales bacterium]MCP5370159.1 tRNA (guanosine(46)-N7)-methyltransferase TrmB [Hyphomicrobiales bacterium]